MDTINKVLDYLLNDPMLLVKKIILKILRLPFIRKLISDKYFIKKNYEWITGKKLNLEEPVLFNEKIQWLKLNNKNPFLTALSDKYYVRQYIRRIIGDKYLIPLIDVYDSVDDIIWEELPEQFVLKCNHASGTNIICKNKEELDFEKTKKQLKKWLSKNYFWYSREWAYKDIIPKIICENYFVDESGDELKDYKFFCFDGEPKLIQLDYNRYKNHKRNLYDLEWNFIDEEIKYPNDKYRKFKKPTNLNEMIKVAKKLSKGFKHVRVDLYNLQDKIYFGEMTFYHGAGHEKFSSENFELILGNYLKLDK